MSLTAFPSSISKAVASCLMIGIVVGWIFFLLAGSRIVYISPAGDLFLIFYSISCGLFAFMSAAWITFAMLNKHNKMLMTFSGFIGFLLAVVTFSFFIAQFVSQNE